MIFAPHFLKMIHNWLVSGLSAVDKGLQLYWEVRQKVQEEKEINKETQSQVFDRIKRRRSHKKSQMTNRILKSSKSHKQSLAPIIEGVEMESVGWSRQQDSDYKTVGGKTVVRVSSSTHHLGALT